MLQSTPTRPDAPSIATGSVGAQSSAREGVGRPLVAGLARQRLRCQGDEQMVFQRVVVHEVAGRRVETVGWPSVVHGSVAGFVVHPAGYESEIPCDGRRERPVSGGADGARRRGRRGRRRCVTAAATGRAEGLAPTIGPSRGWRAKMPTAPTAIRRPPRSPPWRMCSWAGTSTAVRGPPLWDRGEGALARSASGRRGREVGIGLEPVRDAGVEAGIGRSAHAGRSSDVTRDAGDSSSAARS